MKILLISLLLSLAAFSQDLLPTSETVEEKLAGAEEGSQLATLYEDIRDRLSQLRDTERERQKLLEETATAPNEITTAKATLDAVIETLPLPKPGLTLDAAQSQLTAEAAALKETQNQIARIEGEEMRREERQVTIASDLAKVNADLSNLPTETRPLATATKEQQAAFTLNQVTSAALTARANLLAVEQANYAATSELLTAKKLILTRSLMRHEKHLDRLKIRMEKIRSDTVAAEKLTADLLVEELEETPGLSEIARGIAEAAKRRQDLFAQTSEITLFQERVTTQRIRISEQRESAQKRIDLLASAGLSIDTKTGALLRLQRSKLPTTKSLTTELEKHIRDSTTAQIDRLEIEDTIERHARQREDRITKLLAESSETPVSREQIQELLTSERASLSDLLSDYDIYVESLRTANDVTQGAIEEVRTYSLFLDERLLWIPSAPPLAPKDLSVELSAVQALASPDGILLYGRNLILDARAHPALWSICLFFILLLLARRRRLRRRLEDAAALACKKACTVIAPTLKSLVASFFLALPIPLLLAFLGWRGTAPAAISSGLIQSAFFFLLMGFVRLVLQPNGLLPAHLRFGEERSRFCAYHSRWLYYTLPIPLFLASALDLSQDKSIAGRFPFLLLLLIAAIFAHLLLRPGKKVIAAESTNELPARIVYALGVGIPLSFFAGTALGYVSSVKILRIQFLESLWLVLAIILVARILLRWILVSRRRLARDLAIKKYKAAAAVRKRVKDGEAATNVPSLEELEAEAVNVVAVEDQTNKLVKAGMTFLLAFGLWTIWSTSFPALSILDDVKLWQGGTTSAEAAGEPSPPASPLSVFTAPISDSGSPPAETSPPTDDHRISLQDLLGAGLLLLITFIAARNLPGLLELSVLRRLNLQPGGNYAITTVVRYIIIVVGLLIAFGQIGITWSSVQWLAAAVTLGIGFGLQEIFANFVAGIILLFERPIRLGDIITVGEVSGRVTQIEIRATTIRQFNNRELIVPNKEFITGDLVNWTLADNILRFEFNVGVAYGTDTKEVSRILQSILDAHPLVLEDPAPDVLFINFGDSTLDFQLRAFVRGVEAFIPVQSDLHHDIDRAFREADIEISYPQTDLHIRSLPSAEEMKKWQTSTHS